MESNAEVPGRKRTVGVAAANVRRHGGKETENRELLRKTWKMKTLMHQTMIVMIYQQS